MKKKRLSRIYIKKKKPENAHIYTSYMYNLIPFPFPSPLDIYIYIYIHTVKGTKRDRLLFSPPSSLSLSFFQKEKRKSQGEPRRDDRSSTLPPRGRCGRGVEAEAAWRGFDFSSLAFSSSSSFPLSPSLSSPLPLPPFCPEQHGWEKGEES